MEVLIGQKWRHKKRGSIYEVVNIGILQWSDAKILEYKEMVVYRSERHDIWIRPMYEFIDGRFEKIED